MKIAGIINDLQIFLVIISFKLSFHYPAFLAQIDHVTYISLFQMIKITWANFMRSYKNVYQRAFLSKDKSQGWLFGEYNFNQLI